MKTFDLNYEQSEKVKEFIDSKIDSYDLKYIALSLEMVKDEADKYYIKMKTKAKEFDDTSIITDEANITQRILMDTENFIYSEIY